MFKYYTYKSLFESEEGETVHYKTVTKADKSTFGTLYYPMTSRLYKATYPGIDTLTGPDFPRVDKEGFSSENDASMFISNKWVSTVASNNARFRWNHSFIELKDTHHFYKTLEHFVPGFASAVKDQSFTAEAKDFVNFKSVTSNNGKPQLY